jgi:hypothetical protein
MLGRRAFSAVRCRHRINCSRPHFAAMGARAEGPQGASAPFPLGGRDGLAKGIAFLLQVGTLTSTGFE